ncbi:hypothetical protein [Kordia sp.]|uniref:hypothetical protein n=1 Tax=Kordia sp. TaxID=1965332 RepID=UPI003B5A2203
MKKHRKLNLKKVNIAHITTLINGGQGEDDGSRFVFSRCFCPSLDDDIFCRTKRANGNTTPGQGACNNPDECR